STTRIVQAHDLGGGDAEVETVFLVREAGDGVSDQRAFFFADLQILENSRVCQIEVGDAEGVLELSVVDEIPYDVELIRVLVDQPVSPVGGAAPGQVVEPAVPDEPNPRPLHVRHPEVSAPDEDFAPAVVPVQVELLAGGERRGRDADVVGGQLELDAPRLVQGLREADGRLVVEV